MEDSEIIRLYNNRDEAAITHSKEKYGGYCETIARNILGNQEDSEECVSDTWFRAWRAIPPAVPKCLAAFFGKITRNLSINLWKKRTAEKRAFGQVGQCMEELEECIAGEDGESVSESSELREALSEFLKGLKPETREIFMLRYWYAFSIKETAEKSGKTESAVKVSLMRVRGQLKEFLYNEGIEI